MDQDIFLDLFIYGSSVDEVSRKYQLSKDGKLTWGFEDERIQHKGQAVFDWQVAQEDIQAENLAHDLDPAIETGLGQFEFLAPSSPISPAS